MIKVSFYLNFADETEDAFTFYKKVFGTEIEGEITRFGDIPHQDGHPALTEKDQKLIMHMVLPLTEDVKLHGSDAPESIGFKINKGNNVNIMIEPETREETDRLFESLSDGALIEQELQIMFWGDYYGSMIDRFGIHWMFNCPAEK